MGCGARSLSGQPARKHGGGDRAVPTSCLPLPGRRRRRRRTMPTAGEFAGGCCDKHRAGSDRATRGGRSSFVVVERGVASARDDAGIALRIVGPGSFAAAAPYPTRFADSVRVPVLGRSPAHADGRRWWSSSPLRRRGRCRSRRRRSPISVCRSVENGMRASHPGRRYRSTRARRGLPGAGRRPMLIGRRPVR